MPDRLDLDELDAVLRGEFGYRTAGVRHGGRPLREAVAGALGVKRNTVDSWLTGRSGIVILFKNEGNLTADIASGAAPDTTQLSTMRLKLRKQLGISGKRKLSQTLNLLLIPEDLETVTQQVLLATLPPRNIARRRG